MAWARDGLTLLAGGTEEFGDEMQVVAWGQAGRGARRLLPAATNTVMSIVPLPGGDTFVATQDPYIARISSDGNKRWQRRSFTADFRYQYGPLVSDDGTEIIFPYLFGGRTPCKFDISTRMLSTDGASDPALKPPRHLGLPVERWVGFYPSLDRHLIRLSGYEMSRSLAIHPDGNRFVLGTDWALRTFDGKGTPLWARQVPSAAWAVNITGDGRLVVAAYGDGTIRWHRMSDGVELLAFMPLANQKDWVAWTPEGFYDATPGAQGILRWRVNHGWDAPATDVAVADIPGSYRPNLLPLVLQQLETPRALGLAVLAEHNEEVRRRTNSHVPPGTRLHLLSVGVGTYEQDDHLHLKFAEQDAKVFASAITTTQEPLYTVEARSLLNQDANKKGIMTTLASIGRHMEAGGDNDLAVVFFSGHGAMVGANKLYLLPYDADVREDASLRASAISVDELRDALLELAKHGRVLVLLDACHSGATTISGEKLTNNQDALKGALAAANITVLTSSSGSEFSLEDPKWGHGAFTRALLDALGDPMADPSKIGLISSNSLADYMRQHVPDLTDQQQTPGMEVRFGGTVFALAH